MSAASTAPEKIDASTKTVRPQFMGFPVDLYQSGRRRSLQYSSAMQLGHFDGAGTTRAVEPRGNSRVDLAAVACSTLQSASYGGRYVTSSIAKTRSRATWLDQQRNGKDSFRRVRVQGRLSR